MVERLESEPVRVLTVDDYEPFLAAARRLIQATSGFESAGEVTGASDAFTAIAAAEPNLALIDIRMPEIDGIDAARQIAATHPGVLVVLISAQGPDQLPAVVHECGAAAIVRKQDLNPGFLRDLWCMIQSG